MASHDPGADDLAAALVALHQRVEDRRRQGTYPPGLEEQLEEHARRILASRHDSSRERMEALREQLDQIRRGTLAGPHRISTDSRMPGGSLVHAVFARLATRHSQAILEQVGNLADQLVELIEETQAELLGQLATVYELLASYERARAGFALELNRLAGVADPDGETRRRTHAPWIS